NGSAVGQEYRVLIDTVQRRRAALAISEMARDAGPFSEQLLARDERVGLRACRTGKPCGVVALLHDGDPAGHYGVIGAAVLRTIQTITPGFRGTEPHGVVMAGDDVHLYAERRDREIVNYVLASHDQPDVATYWQMHLINFFQAIRLLYLPHPLFADHINVESVSRRMAIVDVDNRAPREHGHGQNQGHHDPGGLQAHVAVDGHANFGLVFALVLEKEINDGEGYRDGDKHADDHDEQHQQVHSAREG